MRVVWFVLCNGINIVSENDELSGNSHCIGVGQKSVDNIDGYNCVCQPGGKQTDTVEISHCNGVDTTSHLILNTSSTRNLIESNITSSLATVCTTKAPVTFVQLPSTCAGNFK